MKAKMHPTKVIKLEKFRMLNLSYSYNIFRLYCKVPFHKHGTLNKFLLLNINGLAFIYLFHPHRNTFLPNPFILKLIILINEHRQRYIISELRALFHSK